MKKKAKVVKRRHSKKSASAYITISKREYDLIMRELSYYREKYDEEKKRADSLVNSLLQTNGIPSPAPAEASLATHPKNPRMQLLQHTLVELLEDEIEDTLEVAPEVAEAS